MGLVIIDYVHKRLFNIRRLLCSDHVSSWAFWLPRIIASNSCFVTTIWPYHISALRLSSTVVIKKTYRLCLAICAQDLTFYLKQLSWEKNVLILSWQVEAKSARPLASTLDNKRGTHPPRHRLTTHDDAQEECEPDTVKAGRNPLTHLH